MIELGPQTGFLTLNPRGRGEGVRKSRQEKCFGTVYSPTLKGILNFFIEPRQRHLQTFLYFVCAFYQLYVHIVYKIKQVHSLGFLLKKKKKSLRCLPVFCSPEETTSFQLIFKVFAFLSLNNMLIFLPFFHFKHYLLTFHCGRCRFSFFLPHPYLHHTYKHLIPMLLMCLLYKNQGQIRN